MSTKGNGRRPQLVADRRYSKSSAKTEGGKAAGGGSTRKPPPNKRAAKRQPPKRRRGPLGWFAALIRWILGLIWSVIWRSTAVVALIVGLAVFYFYTTLPPANTLLDARLRGSVTMLDRDNKVFAWRGDQFDKLTADTASKNLTNAVVATEDKRFYHHFGVDPIGIASAIKINLSAGRGPLSGNGGSTITQQTAKLLCAGVEFDPKKWKNETEYESDCRTSSLWRKAKEAVYAMAMEAKYTKQQILTIYMNRVYLGAGARGFEAASQVYFGKSAADLTPAEGAMLAGLLTAPSYYAPTANLKRSQGRANVVIGLEENQGYLTKAQADEARANPATLSEAAEKKRGGYFADWVMDSGPSFLTSDTTEDVEMYTTFDPRIQKAAEEALTEVFNTKVKDSSEAEAAIIVMSADGAVRAMVGGRKLTGVAGLFNRAVQAKRQTGSSFKPFIYAAALDRGFSPYDTVLDEPLTINVKGSGPWKPSNYDHKFHGRVTLAYALQHSLNIPAIKVSQAVGLENVRRIAEDFGIKSDLAAGPALALGVSESSLLEMTGAYAGILNGGSSVHPFGIRQLRIKGDNSGLMDQEGGMGERVITEKAAGQLVWMMKQVVEGGTGHRAKLDDREAAGKTGTTQAARDAWFVGFTADYVAGVWMGYDDNRPLTGVTGGGLPADIWREVMVRVNKGLPPRPLPEIVPEKRPEPAAQPQAQAQDQPQQRDVAPQGGDQQAEGILLEVLNDLLGN